MRWLEGIWLGTRFDASEHIVAIDIVRTRGVQAMPVEVRWNRDTVVAIIGQPWAPTTTVRSVKPDDANQDPGDAPKPDEEAEGS